MMDNASFRSALSGDNLREKERCLTDMINQLQLLKEQLLIQQQNNQVKLLLLLLLTFIVIIIYI